MPVDVTTEIEIARPRGDVSAFAADPANATAWYENIESVEWKSDPPLAVGSRSSPAPGPAPRLHEIGEYAPGQRLVVRTADGPFTLETTYTWADTASGRPRMMLRNRGEPSGFSRVAGPVLVRAMRRANRKDLARLKELLESREA